MAGGVWLEDPDVLADGTECIRHTFVSRSAEGEIYYDVAFVTAESATVDGTEADFYVAYYYSWPEYEQVMIAGDWKRVCRFLRKIASMNGIEKNGVRK
jgi:hypothetical protein